MAVQGPLPRRPRRRLRRRDAGGPEARRGARRDLGARQGRLARCAPALAAPRAGGRPDAARVAVGSGRSGRLARVARDRVGPREPDAADRLPEGIHGRDARLGDGADARRLRRSDHERRAARRDHPRRRGGRVSGRGARDRRRREPGGARRVRGDTADLGAARAAPPDRARAAALAGGSPPLRVARRRLLGSVLARDLGPRPRRPLLGREDRRRVRLPVAARLGRRRRQRLGRADRGARPAGRHPRGRPADDRRARGLAPRAGGHGSAGVRGDDARARPGSAATSAGAAA